MRAPRQLRCIAYSDLVETLPPPHMPAAVGYVDDVELPLPDPDFLHHVEELTTVI